MARLVSKQQGDAVHIASATIGCTIYFNKRERLDLQPSKQGGTSMFVSRTNRKHTCVRQRTRRIHDVLLN